jgi:vacuolar-type H+-ATPase subunit I/STV1
MKIWFYSLVLLLTNVLFGQAQYIQLSEGTPFPLKNGYAIPLATGKQMFQLLEASRTWTNTRDSLMRLVSKQRTDLRQVQRLVDSLKTDNARIKSYTQNEMLAQQRQFDEERQQQNEKRKQLEDLNELLMSSLDKKRAKQIHDIIYPPPKRQ